MHEWPLILFAVLSQAAVGMVLVSAVLSLWLGPERTASVAGALRLASTIAVPLAVLAVGASFFHLGSPLGGPRALSNLGASWMSREVLLVALFTVGAAAYAWLWRGDNRALRDQVGLVTALLGLATVFATGMIYRLPTRPEWYHWTTVSAGFVTLLAVGALALALVMALRKADASVETLRMLGAVALAGLALLLVGLVAYAPYLVGVSQASAAVLFGSAWFWGRLLLGVGLPLVTGVLLVRGIQPNTAFLSLALTALVGGELVARGLFYDFVLTRLPMF
jgi:anaerobic dimethyl sulfoxide reductase subunit C